MRVQGEFYQFFLIYLVVSEFFPSTHFASTLFLEFTYDYSNFSCRTRLKTVELERDRMSHEVTKVLISRESRDIFLLGESL